MNETTQNELNESISSARQILTDMGLENAEQVTDAEIVETLLDHVVDLESTVWMLEVAIDRGLNVEETNRWMDIAEEKLQSMDEEVSEEDLEKLIQLAKAEPSLLQ